MSKRLVALSTLAPLIAVGRDGARAQSLTRARPSG
jgi:hypothetical protein